MPFCRRPRARGPKESRNGTRERATAQIVGWVSVTSRRNLPLQICTLKKRRDKAALIWPCRRVRISALHSYPLQPRSRGAFFVAAVLVGACTSNRNLLSIMLQLKACGSSHAIVTCKQTRQDKGEGATSIPMT